MFVLRLVRVILFPLRYPTTHIMYTLVVGTVKGGFVFSSDDRETWRPEAPIFRGWKLTAITRSRSGRFLAGVSSFVYGTVVSVSDDLVDWRQISDGPAYDGDSGIKLQQIWRFNVATDTIFAGVAEAGLFRSDNDGETWQPVEGLNHHPTRSNWVPGAGGMCAHALLVDPRNPDRIWCGISAVGVFRSDNGGQTWAAKNAGVKKTVADIEHPDIGFCVHALAADPDDANVIYRQDHMGMYRTNDGGDSWENIEQGLPSGFGFPIAIDHKSRALFAFPQESPEYRMPPSGKFEAYRSLDRGDSWQRAGADTKRASFAGVLRGSLVVDSEDPCGVYAGTTSGTIHISPDGGDSWRILPATLPRILCVEIFKDV
jgi:photosystem II stability/assembly factor-like uncharacterized protein